MDERIGKLGEVIQEHCRLLTTPVGIKLAKEGETPPQKTRYPVKNLGHRLAVCQGVSAARTFGWTMAYGKEDHACPLPRVFMGHIPPDRFLEGPIAAFYQDDPECGKKMEASYPRWPMGIYREIWLSPITRCEFVPDLVVAYGNAAQILTLVMGANFRVGTGIQSLSTGRYGCAAWIAGVIQAGECTYMVPGPGERVFAGAQDHEMSFAVPYSRIDNLIEGLKFIRSKGVFRYPVPNLGILAEARLPEKYYGIEPDPEDS
ncbi:MAG: DUF169 domain-containing protein [Deltaproteobacteria bacterium]|nr:DUF169 domain-containing protein [Deltaproteobacteria bacterium]